MSDTSAVLRLRPVTFRYKKDLDPQGVRQYGLVAEEVAEVFPDLVNYDAEGRPDGIRYNFLTPILRKRGTNPIWRRIAGGGQNAVGGGFRWQDEDRGRRPEPGRCAGYWHAGSAAARR
jgi:hypothetical protein